MLRDLLQSDPSPDAVYQVFGHRDVARAQRVLAAQFVNPVRLDGVDVSDWQEWPTWEEIPGDFFCTRLCDGNYADQMFVQAWQWAQGRKKWPGFYVLPDPRLGWSGQLAKAKDLYARAGVSWGAPGHWWSIDDEPTSLHDQFGGQAFLDLSHAFEDWLQRPQLCYSGYYSPNRSTIVNNAIPWWIPWPPDANGDVPSWAYQTITAHQWGVAGAGEVAGFPGTSVDVDQVMRPTEMDRITLTSGDDDLMGYLSQQQQFDLANRVEVLFNQQANRDFDALGLIRDVYNASVWSEARAPEMIGLARNTHTWSERLAHSLEKSVDDPADPQVYPLHRHVTTEMSPALEKAIVTAVSETTVAVVKDVVEKALQGAVTVNVDTAKIADAIGERLDQLTMRAVPAP